MVRRFGRFEFDDRRMSLTREGQPVRVSGQALALLAMLMERPGELITREEIRRKLWPASHVEFDHSLDVVVSRLRGILDDRGPTPRYVQTVPREGYRFIEPITELADNRPQLRRVRPWIRRLAIYALIALVAAVMAILLARTRYSKFVPADRRSEAGAAIRPAYSARRTSTGFTDAARWAGM